jgi:hypothetical protein
MVYVAIHTPPSPPLLQLHHNHYQLGLLFLPFGFVGRKDDSIQNSRNPLLTLTAACPCCALRRGKILVVNHSFRVLSGHACSSVMLSAHTSSVFVTNDERMKIRACIRSRCRCGEQELRILTRIDTFLL